MRSPTGPSGDRDAAGVATPGDSQLGESTAFDRNAGEVDLRVDTEFLVDLTKVEVDGVARHKEPSRGFPVAQTVGDERCETEFVVVQALPAKPSPTYRFVADRSLALWVGRNLEAQQCADDDATIDDRFAGN
jgi:hypothetical protein